MTDSPDKNDKTADDKPKGGDADKPKPAPEPPKRIKVRVVRAFMSHAKGDELDLVRNKQTNAWLKKNLVEEISD